MADKILVTKASGVKTAFSYQKLRNSLERSGANKEEVDRIIGEVERNLYEGIPTKKIHRLAYSLLRKSHKHHAARYKLKQAIMELGPSGFPFEKYVAEVLKHHGFDIKVGEIVKGHCVNHEIDIIAKQDDRLFMIECKYHNQTGIICDVKIPLYIKARFDDVIKQWEEIPVEGTKFHQGWLVTNTRFSDDAVQYGTCAGLHLVGWDFPEKHGLKEQIDDMGLFPITCLTTLSKSEKQYLLNKKIVLCKEIATGSAVFTEMGISQERINTITKEVNSLIEESIRR